MEIRMTELNRLHEWLNANKDKYGWTVERIDKETESRSQHQVVVYSAGVRLWDAVCHRGSYGCEQGLLETYGDIVDESRAGDSVEGYLTAEDVIERIHERYDIKVV